MRSLTKPLTLSVDGAEIRFRLSLMDAVSGACLLKLITEKFLPHFASLDFSDPETLGTEIFCALSAEGFPSRVRLSAYRLRIL